MQTYLLNSKNKLARDNQQPASWRLLYLLNYYRLSLSLLLVSLYLGGLLFKPLGSHHPELFIITSAFYFVAAVIIQTLLYQHRPGLQLQIYFNICIDISFVTTLMYASGGVTSGLGSLMVISIVCSSILLSGRAAFLPAALASIAILFEHGLMQMVNDRADNAFLQSGILGITYFATSLLAIILSRRIQESEALAQSRGIDLANMAQLTEYVIQRMQTGVIVVDEDLTIRLINESARQMLEIPNIDKAANLSHLSPELLSRLDKWKHDPFSHNQHSQPISTYTDIQPRFAKLGRDNDHGVLIYLEDISATAQQAQQLQLASLGRLTASIAHEIRNPLGAISHAGQLLSESDQLDDKDHRLTQIIADNTSRLNRIVENVMQASRRDPHHIETISLNSFLQKFLADYQLGQSTETGNILIDIQPNDLEIRFDSSQLRQILVNLCDNALRHSRLDDTPDTDRHKQPLIELRGGASNDSNRPYLDVIDHGPGIKTEDIPHIFEPFFTSATNGTGLGLYISRQLAESNQAYLNYILNPTGGACFRISFQDPRRNIN